MYKNRVENVRTFFWNSHSFILPTRKSSRKQSRKIQNIYLILNFPTLNFLIRKIKEWEFQKKKLSFFTLLLYIPCIRSYIVSSKYVFLSFLLQYCIHGMNNLGLPVGWFSYSVYYDFPPKIIHLSNQDILLHMHICIWICNWE